MPYIKRENRTKYIPHIENLVDFLTEDETKLAGELNYIISKILRLINARMGLNYKRANELIGVLECVKLEYYRRIVSEYENKKILENGDI